MAILWPSTIPSAAIRDSYSENIPDGRLRTSMGAGPAKIRPKSAATPVSFPVQLRMTSSQLEDFEEFVNTTLARGSLRFEFPHQRTGATIEARFVGGDSLYTIAPSGFDWTISMQLEVMP